MTNNTSPTSNNHLVAVYGGASIQPDSADWQTAYDVGHALGTAGFRLISGGYAGVMTAASQGASDAGGHVIGVSVGLFEQRGLRLNDWIKESIMFETLRERLFYLVEQPDAIVALRGGVGTLSEISLVWSLIQVGEIPARPFVLVGPMWRRLIGTFAADAAMNPHEINRITFVDHAHEVVPALQAWWAAPPDVPLRLGDDGRTP